MTLDARVAQWRPVIVSLVEALYGSVGDSLAVTKLLVDLAVQTNRRRSDDLRDLDDRREVDPHWFQRPDMIGYVAYADRFADTLDGVESRLDHLAELGVTYFHLMKVLRARSGRNDGGYAVADYGDVEPSLGTRDDLARLAGALRARGISLCLDVVMNHTAREHAWAEQARTGSERHRGYYLTFPDRTLPDRYEATLPEVFPEMAPGNFTWDDDMSAWVWTTFNTYQWDLNYANPDVVVEMAAIICDLANLGVEVFRLDAVAFTWKRMGTNCQNQPEAHLIAQLLRAVVSIAAPAAVLKAEAIVAPGDLVPYLGAHRNQRPECQIAYHSQLMVMIWSAFATGDASLAVESLAALPPTPREAGWVTYLRCHDDIGWAVDDTIAARVSTEGATHRRYLASFYRGEAPGSFALGAPFSSNPLADDERTCGMAASLAGIERARRDGDAVALELAVRRLVLGYALIFSFGGIPLIYMGDEIAMTNDVSYRADPAHADDSRWMHRPHMDWASVAEPDPVAARVFEAMRHLVGVRSTTPQLAGGGETFIHRLDDRALLAWERRHGAFGRFYAIANVSTRPVEITAEVLRWASLDLPREILGGEVELIGDRLRLGPLSMAWFVDDLDGGTQPRVGA